MRRAAVGFFNNINLYRHARAFSGAATDVAAVTHYNVLGVKQTASADEIKHAFRQKAKGLHPDLNAEYTSADGEAFLRLVTAYEVLSDPQQRQLYDLTISTRLPGVLKHAAAAAAAASGSAGADEASGTGYGPAAAGDSHADPFDWRYGLSDWARYGPTNSSYILDSTAGSIGAIRGPVLAALARHRRDLEADLHAGLLKAFLGPKLAVAPGELPPAFEADERANPRLSHDLLHLVHGRTLLGVVRIQQPLQITGGAGNAAASLPASDEHALHVVPALPGLQNNNTTAAPPHSSSRLQMQPAAEDWQRGSSQQSAAERTQDGSHRGHACQLEQQQQQQQQLLHPHNGEGPTVAVLEGSQMHPDHDMNANPAAVAAAAAAADTAGAAAYSAAAGPHSASDDDVISEVQWQELLQLQHPLRGLYAWAPPPALRLTAAGTAAAGPDSLSSNKAPGGRSPVCGSAAEKHANLEQECTLGGRKAKEAWQGMWQQSYGMQADATHAASSTEARQPSAAESGANEHVCVAAAGGPSPSDAAFQGISSTSSIGVVQVTVHAETGHLHGAGAAERSPAGRAGQQPQLCEQQPVPPEEEGLRTTGTGGQYIRQQRQQHHSEVHRQEKQGQHQEKCHEHPSQGAQPQQQQQQQQQQQSNPRGKQQSRWLGQRRLWRWLRSPTADWAAADWSFDDSSEGVLVLQLLLDHSRVTAVAVRDDKQPAKPIKVYINNTFTAAVLDDIVMEPLTGRLMAVLYRYYTPGVHHLYFYLPNKQGSRVLARLQRRWMPPSSTWLFPPMTESHDVGGWVVEWEGHNCQHKTGWIHPSVYLLVAASYSRDMELRKAAGARTAMQQLWEQASDSSTRLGRALQWLQEKWAIARAAR